MNLLAKVWFSRFLARLGVLHVLECRQGPQVVIFALHRVLPADELGTGYDEHIVLESNCFRAFLEWLAKDWRILSLGDFLEQPFEYSGKAGILTFDDGWEDNYRVAFPLLQEFGFPATIFLPTDYIGTEKYMPEERLARLLAHVEHIGMQPAFSQSFDRLLSTITPDDGGNSAVSLNGSAYRSILKRVPIAAKLTLLDALEKEFGMETQGEGRHTITWDEARQMRSQGCTFGSHTVNHTLLACEEDHTIDEELNRSRARLHQELGDHLDVLAYPNGSYDERVVKAASACGYRACVTTQFGTAHPETDLFRLPRIPVDTGVVGDNDGRFSPARARVHVLRAQLSRAKDRSWETRP